MRYFEFNQPYYALVRSEGANKASEKFHSVIGCEPRETMEKTRNEALNMFLINEDAKGERDFSDMMLEFNEDKEAILLVDRGIL